jgi:hypothetical protein
MLPAYDVPKPWVCGVKWYHHANLTPVQVMNPGKSTTVDHSVPIVTKADECVVLHSQEPRETQACGIQSPILGEVEVRVIIRLHLKCRHNDVTNPLSIAQRTNTEICIKANNSK